MYHTPLPSDTKYDYGSPEGGPDPKAPRHRARLLAVVAAIVVVLALCYGTAH